MVLRTVAPELGQVAAVREVRPDQPAKKIGADVRNERQEHDHVLCRRELPPVVEASELRWLEAVPAERPRGLPGRVQVPGEPVGDERIKAGEHAGQVCRDH